MKIQTIPDFSSSYRHRRLGMRMISDGGGGSPIATAGQGISETGPTAAAQQAAQAAQSPEASYLLSAVALYAGSGIPLDQILQYMVNGTELSEDLQDSAGTFAGWSLDDLRAFANTVLTPNGAAAAQADLAAVLASQAKTKETSYLKSAAALYVGSGLPLNQILQYMIDGEVLSDDLSDSARIFVGWSLGDLLAFANSVLTPVEISNLANVWIPKPGNLVAIDAASTTALANHTGRPVVEIPGFMVPATPVAMKAGTMALANAMALDVQNGKMTQATFDQAIAALTPAVQ